jgi:peptidoglycan/LPS O-acetylase OafA/YrhL
MSAGTSTIATHSSPAIHASHLRSAPKTREAAHLGVLDGVRGLAILLVLVYHFTLGMGAENLLSRLFFRLTGAGWCGVDLFFVLSGFLITGILYDARKSPHRFRNFYARRALRIFPLYYTTLTIFFIFLPWIVGVVGTLDGLEDARVWLWAYGTNIHVALRGDWFPLSHFWSLAVEEHFYIFWPSIIIGCRRATAMRVCVGMILLALVVRTWLVSHGAVLAAYCLTACRMDALAMGGFLALATRRPNGLESLVPAARRVMLISMTALLVLAGWRSGLFLLDPAIQVVGYSLLDLCFVALLVVVIGAPRSSRLAIIFESFPLRALGRYSYGLYVFNSIFLLAAERLFVMRSLVAWSGSTFIGRLLYVFIGAFATFAAAWLSWHLVERHFLKLKALFSSQKMPEPSDRSDRLDCLLTWSPE